MALRKLLAYVAVSAFAEEIAATDTINVGGITVSPGNIDLSGTGKVTNSATPTSAGDLTNKAYVDALIQGLVVKPPAKAISITNVATLSGLATTVDGFALNTDGMRVLLQGQTTATENGAWVVHAGAWTRPLDFNTGSNAANAYFFIEEGTFYPDTGWVCTTNSPNAVVDTNNLTFVQFSSAGVITAGAGLQQTGVVISVKAGDGVETTSNASATNVALDAASPGLQFTGASPNGRLQVKATSTGGLQVTASGVEVKIVSTDRLTSSASGLDVSGVPSLFKVGGTAVSANVTSANLGTLTAGSTSNADALHAHPSVSYDLLLVAEPATPGTTYSNTITSGKVTQEKWIRTAGGALLKSLDYTYTGVRVTTEVRKIFATNGVTVVAQMTLTYTYTGSTLTAIVTTRDV